MSIDASQLVPDPIRFPKMDGNEAHPPVFEKEKTDPGAEGVGERLKVVDVNPYETESENESSGQLPSSRERDPRGETSAASDEFVSHDEIGDDLGRGGD